MLRISGILAADSCSAKVALLTAASWRRVLAADQPTITATSRPARRRRALASQRYAAAATAAGAQRTSIDPGTGRPANVHRRSRLVSRRGTTWIRARVGHAQSLSLESRRGARARHVRLAPSGATRVALSGAPRDSLRSELSLRMEVFVAVFGARKRIQAVRYVKYVSEISKRRPKQIGCTMKISGTSLGSISQ